MPNESIFKENIKMKNIKYSKLEEKTFKGNLIITTVIITLLAIIGYNLLSRKMEYRYNSFDARFTMNNMIIVDKNGKPLEDLKIQISIKHLDSFYANYKKSQQYYDLKNHKIPSLNED